MPDQCWKIYIYVSWWGGSLEVKYFQSPRVAVFLDRRETSVSVLFPPMRTGCPLIGAQFFLPEMPCQTISSVKSMVFANVRDCGGARCPSLERWLISNLAAQLLRRRMDIGIATAGFYCKLWWAGDSANFALRFSQIHSGRWWDTGKTSDSMCHCAGRKSLRPRPQYWRLVSNGGKTKPSPKSHK